MVKIKKKSEKNMSDEAIQEVFKPLLPYTAEGKINETLPVAGISRIIIKHNVGTPGGGTYIANTAIEDILIRVGGNDAINWGGGTGIAGQISMGIGALRELYYQKHGVQMPDESFIVELPDALPKNVKVQLIATMASWTSMGISVSYDGTFDIIYEHEDKIKNRVVVPYITWGEWRFTTEINDLVKFITTIPFRLRLLILITHDNNIPSATTYTSLKITFPGKTVFEGKMTELKEQQENKSRVALNTGYYMKAWGKKGLKVPTESMKFNFNTTTAGTDKKVHYTIICY